MISGSQLTVVIPTYRRPFFLAQALESVRAQAVDGLVLRIFDNASNDETPEVVARFARELPLEYICHRENLGAARNIQAALASVRTRYCALLGDDDLEAPGFLRAALSAFEEAPSAVAYCGRTLIYDETARAAYRVQGASWSGGFYRAGQATRHMIDEHFTFTGVVFRSDVFQHLPFSGGDMDFMAHVADRFDFSVGESVTAVWRMHPGSWSRQHPIDEERRTSLERLQSYLQLPTLQPADRHALVERTMKELAHNSFKLALEAVVAGAREPSLFAELARSAGVVLALDDTQEFSVDRATQRLLMRGAGLLARSGPLSARPIHALASACSRAVRWGSPARAVSEAERATLQFISDMERRASEWYR
jgi:hypothetical protein